MIIISYKTRNVVTYVATYMCTAHHKRYHGYWCMYMSVHCPTHGVVLSSPLSAASNDMFQCINTTCMLAPLSHNHVYTNAHAHFTHMHSHSCTGTGYTHTHTASFPGLPLQDLFQRSKEEAWARGYTHTYMHNLRAEYKETFY